MRVPRALLVAVAVLALIAAACGDDSPSATGDARTVEVDMVDIAFEPDALKVNPGETVRFVFTNRGKLAHDSFIGDREAQVDHEAEMRQRDGDHGGGHGEDEGENAVTVEPGGNDELTYTFGDSGTIEVGCHQPDHYEAGMKVVVDVA